MAALKLIQLNIERDKHFDRILPFLIQEEPDVLCVQEISENDVGRIEALGFNSCFTSMNKRVDGGIARIQGIAIFSALPFKKTSHMQYAGSKEETPDYIGDTAESKHATQRFELAIAEVEKDGMLFRIATTHFPWTEEGSMTHFQREDIERLIGMLKEVGEFVLCGDFNAPRGGEIFSMLANAYKDNVPKEYTTSIDGSLHRAGPLPYMVDGIFSSPGYVVSDVRMQEGVSDHCAIIAEVAKE